MASKRAAHHRPLERCGGGRAAHAVEQAQLPPVRRRHGHTAADRRDGAHTAGAGEVAYRPELVGIGDVDDLHEPFARQPGAAARRGRIAWRDV